LGSNIICILQMYEEREFVISVGYLLFVAIVIYVGLIILEQCKKEEKTIPIESWKHKTRSERKAELIFQLYNMLNDK